MNLTFGTFKSERREKERLFTICLTPPDTQYILSEPGGWFMTEQTTHTQLHILQQPFPLDADKIRFEFNNECYTFVSQTGFKTDEEHLVWLISLGRIPMIQMTSFLGKQKTLVMGFVEFERE